MTKEARPFLKWAGGKAKLVDRLQGLLPDKIQTYYEPFLGGGALFWYLASTNRFQSAVLNDFNAELVNTYQVVRDHCDDLIEALRALDAEYRAAPKEIYLQERAKNPADLGTVARAARLIFLNKTGFNGLYRVNKSGRFNVPFGSYANPRILDEENLLACSAALTGVELRFGDFADALREANPRDAVYCDPPYVPLNSTAYFTSYTSGGFGPEDQKRLASRLRALAADGVRVVASNSDTELVRSLYSDFETKQVQMRRSINSKATSRGPISELIFVGKAATAV